VTLVERDAQLGRLAAALEEARHGRGSTVLVSGEAGIGKTSLLQEFAEGAWPTARVLVGACEDLLTPRPLGPFRDMARDAGGLAGLAGDDRDAFLDALLAEMAFTQRPAVVIVEDAHWADAASLDIIRYLARRIDRLSALLVVSYRDEELRDDHPFARMVAALAGPSVLRIELEGLSDEAVTELAVAAGLDPGPVVAAVGGNPFYLTEVLAAPGAAVPPSVRHAVQARFASLPASCRSSLERLAVVPSGVEPWLMRTLVEDPSVLDPAERRGMVVSAQGRSASGTSWPGGPSSCRCRPRGGWTTTAGSWPRWPSAGPSRRGWSTTPWPPPTSRRWPTTPPPRPGTPPGPRPTGRRPPSPGWPWSTRRCSTAWRSPGCTGWPPWPCTPATSSARRPSMPTGRWSCGTRPGRRPWSWARRCSSRPA